MKILTILVMLIGGMSALSVHAVRYEVAASNFQKENYELAYNQFTELAALGNKDAQYAIGVMYVKGLHVKKNFANAYAWILLASSKGEASYAKTADDIHASFSEVEAANARAAFADLQASYGDEVIAAKLMPRLVKAGARSYKRRKPLVKVPADYPTSALNRGMPGTATISYLVSDDGRVKYPKLDMTTAEDFVKPSIRAVKSFIYKPTMVNGLPSVTFDVRNRFQFVLVDDAKIQEDKLYNELVKLKESAVQGSSIDRYTYAKNARVFRRYLDDERASEFYDTTSYFSKAAVDGLPHAKYELGKSIMYGEQCESDFDSSYFWLNQAAGDGLPVAQMMLGLERIYGVRFAGDLEEGIAWLEAAAEKYDPAKVELAVALATIVKGADKDLDKAVGLLADIKPKKFEDKISLFEAMVIVYSVRGEESKRSKSLKRLKKEAKKLNLPFDVLAENIERRLRGETVKPLRT